MTGSWSSGTGTSPQAGQWMIGIGQPQNRCRLSSQSRSRKVIADSPRPSLASWAVIAAMPAFLSARPSRLGEFT